MALHWPVRERLWEGCIGATACEGTVRLSYNMKVIKMTAFRRLNKRLGRFRDCLDRDECFRMFKKGLGRFRE